MASQYRQRDTARQLLRQHPLQRIAAPSRRFSAMLHLAGLASFIHSFSFVNSNQNFLNQAWGRHWQFLTIIGLSLAGVTFLFGLLADLTLSRRLFHLKNAMAVACAPLEVLISALYWGISLIDRKLLIPPGVPMLPLQIDFGLHGAPALFLLVDVLFLSPPWAISSVPALGLSTALATAYWFWVQACYAKNGFYPYPIFDTTTSARVAIFAGAALVMTFSTLCLDRLYSAVNGKSIIKPDGSRAGQVKRS